MLAHSFHGCMRPTMCLVNCIPPFTKCGGTTRCFDLCVWWHAPKLRLLASRNFEFQRQTSSQTSTKPISMRDDGLPRAFFSKMTCTTTLASPNTQPKSLAKCQEGCTLMQTKSQRCTSQLVLWLVELQQVTTPKVLRLQPQSRGCFSSRTLL